MIEDHEPLHARAFDEEVPFDARTLGPGIPLFDGGSAADDDPGAKREMRHRRVADRSRGAVEKYVDVLWTGPAERSAQVSRLIVDRSEEHTSELQSLLRLLYAGFR